MPSHTIPHTYADLSKRDISLLAPIFTAPPAPNTSASSSYLQITRSQVSELPQHLLCKYPLINTYCSAIHAKLNPFPVNSLLSVVKDEVSVDAIADWVGTGLLDREQRRLLEGVNAIWLPAREFKRVFGRDVMVSEEASFYGGKCKACVLARVGGNISTLVILGAVIVARLGHKKWRQSKRIKWMEAWIHPCVQWKADGDVRIREMWDLGMRLRRVRRGDKFSEGSSLAEREKREEMDVPPVRPRRTAEQEDHVAVANEVLQQYQQAEVFPEGANPFDEDADPEIVMGWLFQNNGEEREEQSRTEEVPDEYSPVALNPFADDADPERVMENLFPQATAGEQPRAGAFSHASLVPQPLAPRSTGRSRPTPASSVYSRAQEGYVELPSTAGSNTPRPSQTQGRSHPVASSVYSRPQDEEDETSWNPATESQIIDLYRYTRTPGAERRTRDFL